MMKTMDLRKIIKHSDEYLIGWILCISTVMAFYETTMRYIVGSSTIWSEEINRYLLIFITLVGASVVLKKDGHVRMTILYEFFGKGKQNYLNLIVQLIVFFYSSLITYLSFAYVYGSYSDGYRSTTPLMVYLWIPQLSLCVGWVLMTLRSLELIWSIINEIRNTEVPKRP